MEREEGKRIVYRNLLAYKKGPDTEYRSINLL